MPLLLGKAMESKLALKSSGCVTCIAELNMGGRWVVVVIVASAIAIWFSLNAMNVLPWFLQTDLLPKVVR